MVNCSIKSCKNYSDKTKTKTNEEISQDIKYHRFPNQEKVKKKWMEACGGQSNLNVKEARICSHHFDDDCYEISLKNALLGNYEKTLKRDAVPSDFLRSEDTVSASESEDGTALDFVSQDVYFDPIPTDAIPCVSSFEIEEETFENERSLETKSLLREKEILEKNCKILEEQCSKIKEERDKMEEEIFQLKESDKIMKEERDKIEGEIVRLRTSVENMEKEMEQLKNRSQESDRKWHLVVAGLRKDLEDKDSEIKNFNDALSRIFTPGQIKKLLNPEKRIVWSKEDIAAAISLRSASPKGYRYLYAHDYPTPHLSTLRRWALHLDLEPGILIDVVTLMKFKGENLTPLERLTVICFDEVSICNKICIEKKFEQRFGPSKNVQAAMARGLISAWKQPIYYDYDKAMTKSNLMEIISALYEAGYIVVAVTSDMGPRNLGLWSELKVDPEKKCFFTHPKNEDLKIFIFADVPHLLKLLRNHLIDSGFRIGNVFVNTTPLRNLLEVNANDLKVSFKISNYHLNVKGSERQRVAPACQLYSNNTYESLAFAGQKGYVTKGNWAMTAKFIKLTNDWFDTFNSKNKFGSHPGANAFGINIEEQTKTLTIMSNIISVMRVGKHKTLVPFQKGILLCNKSLIQLYEYLKVSYDIQYLLTYRLNQDVIENFFGYMRGMGGPNDHPTPLDFRYRLRWYILGKHSSAIFTVKRNTEENGEACLLTPEDIQSEECVSGNMLKNVVTEKDLHDEKKSEEEMIGECNFVDEIPELNLKSFVVGTEEEALFAQFESFNDNNKSNGEDSLEEIPLVREQLLLPMETDDIPELHIENDVGMAKAQFESFEASGNMEESNCKNHEELKLDEKNLLSIFEGSKNQDSINYFLSKEPNNIPQLDLQDYVINEEEGKLLEEFQLFQASEEISKEGLKYIAGYAAYKFRAKYPNLGTETKNISNKIPDWINFVSKGSLKYPSTELMAAAELVEDEFQRFHKDFLSQEKFIFQKVTEKVIERLPETVKVPREVVNTIVRTRTYIRLRCLNCKISLENIKKTMKKKMAKITNDKTLKKEVAEKNGQGVQKRKGESEEDVEMKPKRSRKKIKENQPHEQGNL